jgi:nucleoside-diphosphate-sugar epimerase
LIKSVIEKEASGVFIAGDHSPLSTTDVIKYIAIGLNKRIYLFKFPSLVLKIFCLILPRYSSRIYGSLVISNKSTNERLQFNPPYSSEKGIFEMVRWYLKKKKLVE